MRRARAPFPALRALLGLAAVLPAVLGVAAIARAEDAERATHADHAATPQVSFEARHGDVLVRQYQLGCLSQLTYLLVAGKEAAVVDPQRDVEHYLRDAERLGAKITHVFLTHTNADFVAGHTEIARKTGAKVYMSGESGSLFPYEPLKDGSRVPVGSLVVEAWATPGHTLDSMTLLLHVPGATADPAYALTGDTLFVGGIGRPDLVGGDVTPIVLATKAYDSLQRLLTLPAATMVLPAHGAGSLCGAHLSPETTSSIGAERETNPYLAPMSRTRFVSRVVSGLPVAPGYFRHNAEINRKGPPVVDATLDLPPALEPKEAKARADAGAWIVDLRDSVTYAKGHVEGAVNVSVRGRLDTWTGIVVPFDAPIVLFGSEDEVRETAFRYRRIGIDGVTGYVKGGLEAWRAAGLPVRTSALVSAKDLAAQIAKGQEPVIVDVRTPDEIAELRLGEYATVPLSEWESFGRLLDRKAPVLFLCNSAYRSSMAVGLAERQGFEEVRSLDGGLDAWLTAGLPVKGTAKLAGQEACPQTPGKTPAADGAARPPLTLAALPEPVDPTSLAQALSDQPALYAVLDVRPAWAFDAYHVPGAVRTAPEAVLEKVRSLPAGVRVVIVDRDGSTAYAIAGAVAQALGDPARVLRVLAGGTARFHREIELGAAPAPEAAPGAAAEPRALPPSPAPAPAATPAPAPSTPAPKKRPAGC